MTNSSLAATYKNFGELYDAGVDIVTLLESLHSTERNKEIRTQLRIVIQEIKRGNTLAGAMAKGKFLPAFDVPAIQAGERSGTLMRVFEALSKKYEIRAQAERVIKAGLIKPISLLAVGLFVLPFPDLFNGKITLAEYLITSCGIFGAFMLFVILMFRFNRKAAFDVGLADIRHRVCMAIPGVRGIIKMTALENFVSSFAHLLDAGMPMYESLELAYRTSPDRSIRAATKRILAQIKRGGSLSDAFALEQRFGPQIHAAITLGAKAGKIPVLMHRQAAELNRQIIDSVEKLSKYVPGIIYTAVAIYVAIKVFGFYSKQFKGLEKMLEGA